ncbi:L-threonylcarbamoyladenylate synthase [Fredinandcohnia quinoae]|uniref:Threonylcarbamoyl-AMP synthase n=1 Tax=Fredinandcohnia quinoae TaxID=2918902 RepID=A0AAW5DWV0_9BACI|nr:L-threonylcarbamoyladenylate synthase [Fredinandcohnia sp. SECRCQ15]MCH1625125.1 threonylcarbamoyl-AMP synthase [Fredinandcohnia sp. SECRCQ15]
MDTKYWVVDKQLEQLEDYPQIKEAAKLLQENEVVAFPTETVYGLGANAKSDEAVDKIYQAKGRPSDNPLIVHIAKIEQVDEIAEDISETARSLIAHFWPGPLTLVLKKKANAVSEKVTPGRNTVAVRMPDHPLALALIRRANLPLAAPSANLSGKPSPTLAGHVSDDLSGRVAGILDGGATGVGLESTVLDCTDEIPIILRPGGVTKEQLEEICGKVEIDRALLEEGQAPKAPGMKYKHYAPTAPLYIVNGTLRFMQALIAKKQQEGYRVGVLTTNENEVSYVADAVISCGTLQDLRTVASNLYEALRLFDKRGVDVIYSEDFPSVGIGQAIMNRLEKAAAHKFIYENEGQNE